MALHVVHTLDKLAGPNGRGWSVLEHANHQADAGFQVTILGTEVDPAMQALAPSLNWVVHPTLRPHRDPQKLDLYTHWIGQQLNLLDWDVVNAHEGADLLALHRLGVRPLVYTAHSEPSYGLVHMPKDQVEAALQDIDGLLTLGGGTGASLSRLAPLPRAQGVVFPTIDWLRDDVPSADWPGSPQIICVGRLDHNKNHQLAIRALALLQDSFPDVQLALVGQPSLRDELRELASELGVSGRVQIVGHRTDVHRLMAGADVLLMPSLKETVGRSAMEAMLLKVPVAGSHAVSELLGDGQFGEMFSPDDPEACAAAVERSLGRTPDQLEAARGRALQMGDRKANLDVYSSVLSEAARNFYRSAGAMRRSGRLADSSLPRL